jgi:hypothetical protein
MIFKRTIPPDGTRTHGGGVARRRLDLRGAAEALGTSVDAVRKRVARGTLESEKADGKVYVWLDDDAPRSDTDRLISTLEEQLRLEREAHAEARRLLAAALERIPQLGAPRDERGSPEKATEKQVRAEPSAAGGAQDAAQDATQDATQDAAQYAHYLLSEFWVQVKLYGLIALGVLSVLGAGSAPLIAAAPPLGYSESPWGNLAYALFLLPSVFGYFVGNRVDFIEVFEVVVFASMIGGGAAVVLIIGGMLLGGTSLLLIVLVVVGVFLASALLEFFFVFEHDFAGIVGGEAAGVLVLIIGGMLLGGTSLLLIVLVAVGVFLATALLVFFAIFMGVARIEAKSRRRGDDTSRPTGTLSTSVRGWSPRQQALVGLVGTIITALFAFFGVLVQVLTGGGGG